MKINRRFWIFTGIVYALLLGIVIVSADLDMLPTELLNKLPYYDLWGHFIIYGFASVISYNILKTNFFSIFKMKFPSGPLLIAFFTAVEEILQKFIPTRNASIMDFAAGIAGIVLFYLFYAAFIDRIFSSGKKSSKN